MASSSGNAQTFHMLVNPIIQLLNFIGFHFLFSLIYRSIPWTKVSWIILLLETILIIIPSISEFYLIKTYHSSYNYYYGLVILATNHLELAEYIISTFLSQIIVLAVLFSVLATFATIVAKRLSHKVEQTRFFQKISEPSWFFICISSLVFVICTAFNVKATINAETKLPIITSNSTDRMIWCTITAVNERTTFKQHQQKMLSAEHFQSLFHKPVSNKPLEVILILGESARADLMSAYNYHRPTTPWLKSISDSGKVIVFNDVCSPACKTITSCQRIFTFWDSAPNKQWYNYPELTNIFKRAGYSSNWFTNQSTTDIYSVEKLLANSADSVYSTNPYEETEGFHNCFDEKLLQLLPQTTTSKGTESTSSNKFTVIHLMGSHQGYDQRYPQAFEYFKPSDMKECLTDDAKRQKAAYLNSLRYTDHLLEKMIKHYSSQRALVFYFSDHGEMVDEPQQRGFFGHGGNVNHPSVDVPFFVYASPQLRKEHPELWERIKKAQFRPISTAWFTNSLTSLLGIRTKYNDERYNFFSDKFANPTRIAVQGDERHTVPPLKRKRVKG